MLATTDASTNPVTITVACPRPGLALVTLSGELDLAAVERLRAVLAAALTRPEVVVDAAAVGFVECRALHPLVEAARTAAAGGGRLVLRDPSPAVVDLVAWCALGEELPTEAVRARRRESGEDQLGYLAAAGAEPW